MKNLLIVDDDPILRELLVKELERVRYSCIEAGHADEAWEKISSNSIDCVISDLAMTEGSGFDLIKRIKSSEAAKDIPIIIISGVLDFSIEKAREMGADHLLIKPFLTDELTRVITSLE